MGSGYLGSTYFFYSTLFQDGVYFCPWRSIIIFYSKCLYKHNKKYIARVRQIRRRQGECYAHDAGFLNKPDFTFI